MKLRSAAKHKYKVNQYIVRLLVHKSISVKDNIITVWPDPSGEFKTHACLARLYRVFVTNTAIVKCNRGNSIL